MLQWRCGAKTGTFRAATRAARPVRRVGRRQAHNLAPLRRQLRHDFRLQPPQHDLLHSPMSKPLQQSLAGDWARSVA